MSFGVTAGNSPLFATGHILDAFTLMANRSADTVTSRSHTHGSHTRLTRLTSYHTPLNIPITSPSHPHHIPATPTSPGEHTRRCELLDADYVSARASALIDIMRNDESWRYELGFFMSHDVLEKGYSFASRSRIDFNQNQDIQFLGPDSGSENGPNLRQRFIDFFGMKKRF